MSKLSDKQKQDIKVLLEGAVLQYKKAEYQNALIKYKEALTSIELADSAVAKGVIYQTIAQIYFLIGKINLSKDDTTSIKILNSLQKERDLVSKEDVDASIGSEDGDMRVMEVEQDDDVIIGSGWLIDWLE